MPKSLRVAWSVLTLSIAAACGPADLASMEASASFALTAQDRPLVAVSAGNGHSCALRDDGGVTCWGLDNYDQSISPAQTGYEEVSAGSRFSCAVKNGDVDCWGNNDLGQLNTPGVLVRDISSGDGHSCGITDDGDDGLPHEARDPVWFDYESSCTLFQDDDGGLYFWDATGLRAGIACRDYDGDVVAPSRNAATIGSCWVPIFARSPNGSAVVVPVAALAPTGAASEVAFSSAACSQNSSAACTVRWQPRDASVSANLGTAGSGWYTGAATVIVKKPAWGSECPVPGSSSDFTWSPPGTGSEDPSCTECDGTKAAWTMARGASADAKWQYVDNPHAHPTVVIVHEGNMQLTTSVSLANRPDAQSTIASEHWPMFTLAVLGNFQVANGATMVIGVGTRKNGYPSLIVSGNLQMPASSRLILASRFHVTGNINGPERLTSFAQANDRIVCWGDDGFGQATPPAGSFTSVSAGGKHSCALVQGTGDIQCWGTNVRGQAAPPLGSFRQVSSGDAHTCAVTNDARVRCWGYDDDGQASPPPIANVAAVGSGDLHTCALLATGEVTCWGNASDQRLTAPAGPFMSIEVGAAHACATRASGEVACWGKTNYAQANVPRETFATIASGTRFACGVLAASGSLACFGRDEAGQSTPPAGTSYQSVSVGEYHGCALDEHNQVRCWGSNDFGQLNAPSGPFVAVSAGGFHNCALRDTGVVECWGANTRNQATVPPGRYASVSSGHDHTCALRIDGTVACWGRVLSGKTVPPAGAFVQLAAGRHHNCALTATGAARCWGMNQVGQSLAPAIAFERLFAGGEQTCGITSNQDLVCWGQNQWGQSTIPTSLARVLDVSVGDTHVCALDERGAAVCWGYIARNL